MTGLGPGCVKTIFWELWRKIDSRSIRLTHETFITPVVPRQNLVQPIGCPLDSHWHGRLGAGQQR